MIRSFARLRRRLAEQPGRLLADRRGNVMMIFGAALFPICFATGMAVDYGSAMRIQTKLAAAADAAALAAVSHQVMSWSRPQAEQAARLLFQIQTRNTPGLTLSYTNPAQFNVVIQENNGNGNANQRTATVTFRGTSNNMFAGILGYDTLTVKGTAVASATTAPDIDFYVVMDTSPSMALPITRAGLTQLTGLTGGCAFACHSTNDATAVKNGGGRGSYYEVAQSYSIPLRVAAEKDATGDMIDLAQTTEGQNDANYRFGIYSFDVAGNFKTLGSMTDVFATAKTAAASAQLLKVYSNNFISQGVNNNDMDSGFTDMFSQMLTKMPMIPGNGTRRGSDTPQAMMFLVTDGMRDENINGRQIGAITTAQCDSIKARGIRIAVLYTEYLPESLSDDWSRNNVSPKLPFVAPALENCASSGLYYKVTTDEDISSALSSLFQKAVATARRTQ